VQAEAVPSGAGPSLMVESLVPRPPTFPPNRHQLLEQAFPKHCRLFGLVEASEGFSRPRNDARPRQLANPIAQIAAAPQRLGAFQDTSQYMCQPNRRGWSRSHQTSDFRELA